MYDLTITNFPHLSRPGICFTEDPELWHSNRRTDQDEAKRLCGQCPVRHECLTWALDNDEEWGIWGGLDPRERRTLTRAA